MSSLPPGAAVNQPAERGGSAGVAHHFVHRGPQRVCKSAPRHPERGTCAGSAANGDVYIPGIGEGLH